MFATFKSMLKSRKFWGAVFGTAAIIGAKLGLDFDPEEALAAAIPFISYVLGVAFEDGKLKQGLPPPVSP